MAHGINTTIVEIDPIVHDFATKYFNLPSNHTLIIEDATIFVDKIEAEGAHRTTYDYIIHDVFTGGAEPVELFTQEFLTGLSNSLSADGVIAIASSNFLTFGDHITCKTNDYILRTTREIFSFHLPV